ncbi:hypothetical protein [Sphingomonas sp. CROZ-RG-20F-R02-07]|uniref:hypothetical protein n=1 Tax=Sphingomonas sp. CROZ-RG-20F-R02-07 TaxID=2914832 RepID=UPI001F564CE6|nr:hypothetical protein [Sphingomonas sp. CROZ-RG-20F-R02-07]
MFYDTHYRHNEALSLDALGTLPAALHALNAAVDDCSRAGKPLDRDAAILLLIRNLADVAERDAASVNTLRQRCAHDRVAVIAAPALLDIAGNNIAGNDAAKRTFHYQARRALVALLAAIGLDPDDARINTSIRGNDDEGTTEMRHADLAIRIVPRGFVLDTEISFNRCRDGQDVGRAYRAPIAELLDASAFQRRLSTTIGELGATRLAA